MPLPFAALIPAIAGIGGALIQRGQSRRDIARQNQYNSPINQVNRLKQAGLPMAAMGNNISNTQSSLPQTNDGGVSNIGGYITTQRQLQEIEALKQDIRSKKVQADKDEAILTWLQELRGEDRQVTNLTQGLKTQYEISNAEFKGKEIANRISGITEQYTGEQQRLNIEKAAAEIRNILESNNLLKEHTRGAELDNKIKSVVAEYQKEMSDAQLEKLLSENNLLKLGISGKELENGLQAVRLRIEQATESGQIYGKDMTNALAGLTYDRVAAEFENYQQYQQFVQQVQDHLHNPSFKGGLKAAIAMAYTTITGLSGSSPGALTLMNYIK